MPQFTEDFTALPLRALADTAISAASGGGASYADFRIERHRRQMVEVKERDVEDLAESLSTGFAIRVLLDGRWGFASSDLMTPDEVRDATERALESARALASISDYRVELAPEPAHQGEWSSPFRIDPFTVPLDEKIAYLVEVNSRVLAGGLAKFCSAFVDQVSEQKFFASSEGTETTQRRTRLHANFEAVAIGDGKFAKFRSTSLPVGRGYEHLEEFGYLEAADEATDLLSQKLNAPPIPPGRYDLVIHPTNLWLTIHESIGHATELDRALGFEANYAGTSFATPDQLGELRYGSPAVTVKGDRLQDSGLASVGWDDDGVAAQEWDLIRDGILVGYQLNREIAAAHGFERSNGCAFADSWLHVPIQRMPNVSLQPAAESRSIEDLIAGVDDGIYVVGDDSWSIDMKRLNFQFTGQLFYRISSGRLDGMYRDVAYQANTIDFWNSCEAVGGPGTYVLGGAFNCGKGQPGQVAPVSHGAPAALFRDINVLNTAAEQ